MLGSWRCRLGAAAAAALWPLGPRRLCEAQEDLRKLRASPPPGTPELYARRWVEAPGACGAPSRATRLRVAQFNVLADGLSGQDPNRGGFTSSPPGSLDWRYRSGRLIEELTRHGRLPDVIALEEVDHYSDWFEPVLAELGYEGSFVSKPNSPCKKSLDPSLSDGCALFWRKDSMSLVHLSTVNYDGMLPDGQPSGKKDNQVAIVAKLRPSGAGVVAVAVTHLAAKKAAAGERQRAQQLGQLLSKLEELRLPCVLMSDLNAAPEQGATANYASEAYPLALSHGLGLRSAYAEVLGGEPAYTTWKRRGSSEAMHTIDYIFISDEISARKVLAPPALEDVDEERFPSWRYPSDHVALFADLEVPGPPVQL